MNVVLGVAKNTGLLYARIIITVFISLFSTRLILAALGVSDFGLFNVVGGVVSMLSFLNSSMTIATQRFMSIAQGADDLEKVKRIFNMSSLLHWFMAILILLLLEGVGYFFFNRILNIDPDRVMVAQMIYQFMVISTIFTVISVPYDAVITSNENMLAFAVMGVLESFLKLGIALYIIKSSYDRLILYGILTTLISIFLLIIKRIYCHKKYEVCHLQLVKYYDKSLLKEMGVFASWSFLGTLSGMLLGYGQNILINIFFGTTVNAAQSVSRQISSQLSILSLTLVKALNPLIDKNEGSGNRELMMKITLLGTKTSFFLLSFLLIPFFLEMPFLLQLWLKSVPNYTIIFCYLMLSGILLEQFYIPLNNAIAAVGNIKSFHKIDFILNILPLFIVYILFSKFYPPQAFYFISFIFILFKIVNTLLVAKENCKLNLTLFIKNILIKCLLPFFLLLGIGLVVVLFFPQGYFRLFLILLICIIFYPIIIWHIGLNRNELFHFKQIFNLVYKKIYAFKIFSKIYINKSN